MADFQIPDKTLLTAVDRAVDSWLIYDNSATALKRTTAKYALDLTSHPVGVDDTQPLTAKTLTSPTINGATLSGTLAGTYTIGGTPTFPSSVVTLTGSQTLTNKVLTSPTINSATITNPTLAVDTVSEHTSANGVTIDSLNIKDGKLNTNDSVVTANIKDLNVTTGKLADASVVPTKWANPYKFRVYRNAAANAGINSTLAKIVFDTENYDTNNNFATGTYTAPVAGFYHFDWRAKWVTGGAEQYLSQLYKNGAVISQGTNTTAGGVAHVTTQGSDTIQLAANDTIEVWCANSAAGAKALEVGSTTATYLSGYLVSIT